MIACLAISQPATVPRPQDALAWAIAHQAQLDPIHRPWYRYVWIPPWLDQQDTQAVLAYAINECLSQVGLIRQPTWTANGWMACIYLPEFCRDRRHSRRDSRLTELQYLSSTWDSLALDDPYFHVPPANRLVKQPVAASFLPGDQVQLLSKWQASASLVYRADWFLSQVTHQRYYDFIQAPSTMDSLLDSLGADAEEAARLEGDQAIGMLRSEVTAKPRRIYRIQGALGRHGTGAIWITHDQFNESIDRNKHPLYSLLERQTDGSEVIWERANGTHGYGLFDGRGRLVKAAPPNLVADHTIPAPHTRQLSPAISCIRCHGPDDGLRPAANHVKQLLESGVRIVDDRGRDSVRRAYGLYAGDFDRRLDLGRDDYDLAVRRATSTPLRPQGLGVKQASQALAAIYGAYHYAMIDAATACWELGYEPGEDPLATLQQVLPAAEPEIITLAALRLGQQTTRADWETTYEAAMKRKP